MNKISESLSSAIEFNLKVIDELQRQNKELEVENKKLKERLKLLDALEAGGVDNWEGYDIAIDMMGE